MIVFTLIVLSGILGAWVGWKIAVEWEKNK